MKLDDYEKKLASWRDLKLDSDAEIRIRSKIQKELHALHDLRGVRRHHRRALQTAMVIMCSAAAMAGLWVIERNKLDRKGVSPTAATNFTQPRFQPPTGFTDSQQFASPNGDIVLYVYRFITNNGQSDNLQYDFVSNGHLLYQFEAPYTTGEQPLWFTAGSTQYCALKLPPPLLNPTNAPGADFCTIEILRFAHSTPDHWSVTTSAKDVRKDLGFMWKQGNKLLVRGGDFGFGIPIWYSFSPEGVTKQTVNRPYPEPGDLPKNSVIYRLNAKSTKVGDVTTLELSGDPGPLHLKVGQTFVLEITPTPAVPIAALLYPDYGDPGDGSLAWRLPSPYTNAMVYKMATVANHGRIFLNPVPMTKDPVRLTGLTEIPVVVTK